MPRMRAEPWPWPSRCCRAEWPGAAAGASAPVGRPDPFSGSSQAWPWASHTGGHLRPAARRLPASCGSPPVLFERAMSELWDGLQTHPASICERPSDLGSEWVGSRPEERDFPGARILAFPLGIARRRSTGWPGHPSRWIRPHRLYARNGKGDAWAETLWQGHRKFHAAQM